MPPLLDTIKLAAETAPSISRLAEEAAVALSGGEKIVAASGGVAEKNEIPPFVDGFLPPGTYSCNWARFVNRFGFTPARTHMLGELEPQLRFLKSENGTDAYFGGSFVSEKPIPGDIDFWFKGKDIDLNRIRTFVARGHLPFPDMWPESRQFKVGEDFHAKPNSVVTIEDWLRNPVIGRPVGIVHLNLSDNFDLFDTHLPFHRG